MVKQTLPPDTPLCVWLGPQDGYYFAHGQNSTENWLVRVTPNGASVQRATALQVTQAMGEYLRKGYTRTRASMYFDPVRQKLAYTHPDISWGGRSWILAAQPPSLPQSAELVADMLSKVPEATLTRQEIGAWEQRQQNNTKYLVAFNDDPAFALALATQALRQGWIMRSHPDLGPPPREPIETAHAAWDEWLGQTFKKERIVDVRLALGLHSVPAITIDVTPSPVGEVVGDDSFIGMF